MKIGDYVYLKSGVFPVLVVSMEIVQTGQKYGASVDEATVLDRSLVVGLGNDTWAYGDQVEPAKRLCSCGRPLDRGNTGLCLTCEKIEADITRERMER